MQSAATRVQRVARHLSDLDKVKQHASAQIRDCERLIRSSTQSEQAYQKQLQDFKSEVCRGCFVLHMRELVVLICHFCAVSFRVWKNYSCGDLADTSYECPPSTCMRQ